LIKSIFEKNTRFQDSLFYDISSWTLPLAFALDFVELKTQSANLQGDNFNPSKKRLGKTIGVKTEYAYVIETYSYYAPRALYRLLSKGIRVKVANHAFHNSDGKKFAPGSILIPLGIQEKSTDLVEYLIKEIATEDGIDVYAFNTGLDYVGSSLGSNSF